MSESIFANLRNGVAKVKSNTQLFFTILIAFVIVFAFLFMAERFVGIANDAEERLINVRIGSIQDAFVAFASDKIDDSQYLNQKISEIVVQNQTIRSFRVLRKVDNQLIDAGATSGQNNFYQILASNVKDEVGSPFMQSDFLYMLAAGDPTHSITIESAKNNERLFNTARAIVDTNGSLLAVVVTEQTLSEADKAVQTNINQSLYLLVFIIILVLALFLRHSRIIDYMSLYAKLKEVDHLKDDFISMASHELRTPLTVIRGYAEFIREAPDLSVETKDYAEKINISAQGLDNLIADILDVSRIEQGRMSIKLEKLSPLPMLKEVVESFVLPAKEKGLIINLDDSKAGPDQVVSADKSRLKQVFINIIGNAIKYTEKGSVTVSQYLENDEVCFRVSDTGIGLSSEEREKLFEKFYRVKNKQTENIRGTGLGLWICAEIIKQMGGKISVESIKGVGTHFVIKLPINRS